jgi:transcriptional regulator with XRE-family HTH domain
MIRSYRMANRLTQEEFAVKTGVSPPAISQYESGQRPAVAVAKRIAALIGMDWTLFYEGVGEEGE